MSLGTARPALVFSACQSRTRVRAEWDQDLSAVSPVGLPGFKHKDCRITNLAPLWPYKPLTFPVNCLLEQYNCSLLPITICRWCMSKLFN